MNLQHKMNPEVKQKWIEALKSGEYKKGDGTLKTSDNEYCCLGVLCDVFHKETGRGEWLFNGGRSRFSVDSYMQEFFLPPPVFEWAGLKNRSPAVDNTTLAYVNDYQATTFEPIIELIDAQL
jgi:hypothetical protein